MSVSRETSVIEMFYSPGQPRDSGGRFAKSGGGGGAAALHKSAAASLEVGFMDPNYSDAVEARIGRVKAAAEDLTADISSGMAANGAPGVEVKVKFSSLKKGAYVVLMDLSKDGQSVGDAERVVYENSVHHEGFSVKSGAQGQGIGSAFLKASEDAYRARGIEEITVFANVDVGGYAWARAGFDFADPTRGGQDVVSKLAKEYRETGNGVPPSLFAMRQRIFDAQLGGKGTAPTAFEWSQFGREPGMTDWPGKRAMLGSNWDGKKSLAEPSTELSATELFYDAGQPRGADGRWTDSGGPAGLSILPAPKNPAETKILRERYGVKAMGWGAANPQDAAAALGMASDLTRKYPTVKVNAVQYLDIVAPGHTGALADAEITDQGTMIRFYAPEWRAAGYTGPGSPLMGFAVGNSMPAVMAHEWGHAVAAKAFGVTERESLMTLQLAGDVADHRRESGERMGIFKTLQPLPYVSDKISRYAATNPHEAYAEAFADVEYNGEAAAPLSKALHRSMVSRLGQSRTTLFYSPSQPRAADGKWSKSSGGAGHKIGVPQKGPDPRAGQPVGDRSGYLYDSEGHEVAAFTMEDGTERTLSSVLADAGNEEVGITAYDARGIEESFSEMWQESVYSSMAGASMAYYDADTKEAIYQSDESGEYFDPGSLVVSGRIEGYDEESGDSSEVGQFSRIFTDNGGKVSVKHSLLTIEEDSQGQGIGSDFLQSSESMYRDIGVDRITLDANIDVGGYAWARAGFDFDRPEEAHPILQSGIRKLEREGKDVPQSLRDALKVASDFDYAPEAKRSGIQRPMSSFEISQMGREEGATSWVGKEIMLDSTWSGSKSVAPPEVPEYLQRAREARGTELSDSTVDLFYSPSQPRADDGKWTDGGGGGSAAKVSPRMQGWKEYRERWGANQPELDAITKYMAAEITDKERSAIEYMKSDIGASNVNGYLRDLKGTDREAAALEASKPMAKAAAAVETMDGLMADIPAITEPITMYRGYRGWEDYLPSAKALKGAELADEGFMFTSADMDIAQYYADDNYGGEKTLMMKFDVPAGSKVLPFWGIHESHYDERADDYTSKEAYSEVLLPRGAKLTVTEVQNGLEGYTANASYTQ